VRNKQEVLTAKSLLALASTVILGSGSHGTHDLILRSDGNDTDRVENDASNNSSLPREHVYRSVYLQRYGDTQIYPQTGGREL
jgi:hypothetical protein